MGIMLRRDRRAFRAATNFYVLLKMSQSSCVGVTDRDLSARGCFRGTLIPQKSYSPSMSHSTSRHRSTLSRCGSASSTRWARWMCSGTAIPMMAKSRSAVALLPSHALSACQPFVRAAQLTFECVSYVVVIICQRILSVEQLTNQICTTTPRTSSGARRRHTTRD